MSKTHYMFSDIDQKSSMPCIAEVQAGDTLWVSTDGGNVVDALAIYDVLSMRDVTTIATGACFSSGLIVLLAGKRRYATEHCRFLTHPVLSRGTDRVQADIDETALLQRMMVEIIANQTGMSTARVAGLLRPEQYFFGAVAAIEMGIIHGVYQESQLCKPLIGG
jgi:ATP-dependent protease ClpP protease subunit